MINILLNGKEERLASELSVLELLNKKNIRPEVVTVEFNDRILTREEFPQTVVRDSDRIEFVYFMGGGTARIFPALRRFVRGQTILRGGINI